MPPFTNFHPKWRPHTSHIVLVHGSRYGGWCWEALPPHLEQRGHVVHPVNLTGMGADPRDRSAAMHALLPCDQIISLALVIPVAPEELARAIHRLADADA
ncbi:alpha/beta fold hydrolase [Sphingobium sp. PNB]|uniref:alpha/beta fold hydrolase n=1 Tax=Sphingobium sp. PNB TaxID=863934 RepID=UPI0039AED91E